MKEYFCRICWNTGGWAFPSGESARLEKGTFVAKNGFGFEEWLMRTDREIAGWHYGFVQPLHHVYGSHHGETIALNLYSFGPQKRRLYVAKIDQAEVLSPEVATQALSIYQERGWFASMQDAIARVNGNVSVLNNAPHPTDVLNIRFRGLSLRIFDPQLEAKKPDSIWSIHRYTLTAVEGKKKGSSIRRPIMNHVVPQPTVRTQIGSTIVNPIERLMQVELYHVLESRFPHVHREENWVDLKINDGETCILIEVKAETEPKKAIRAAIGQLLEYAYFDGTASRATTRLVIVAQGELTPEAGSYLSFLSDHFNLTFDYRQYVVGSNTFGAL